MTRPRDGGTVTGPGTSPGPRPGHGPGSGRPGPDARRTGPGARPSAVPGPRRPRPGRVTVGPPSTSTAAASTAAAGTVGISTAAASTAVRGLAGARTAGAGPAGRSPAGTGRRPGEHWKRLLVAAAAVAILAGAAWALLGSSLLVVRSVQVTGASRALRAQVLRAAGIAMGTPLIRLEAGRAASRVERLTLVQSAQVSRSWPDTVVITVTPRTAVLAVASGGQYEQIDPSGVVLRSAPARPRRLPLLSGLPAGPLRGSSEVRAAALVYRELPARIRHRVFRVLAPAPSQISLQLRGDLTIVWGSPALRAQKAAELRILMRHRAVKYIDIADPGSAMTSDLPGAAATAPPAPAPSHPAPHKPAARKTKTGPQQGQHAKTGPAAKRHHKPGASPSPSPSPSPSHRTAHRHRRHRAVPAPSRTPVNR